MKIDCEEKEMIVDVALAASRAQSARGNKLSPSEALLRGLGSYIMFRKAQPHEVATIGTRLFSIDELAEGSNGKE
ncbi:MAG: hypothetical protein ACKOVA_14410 [Novosphingobium sp.]